ncbi:DUF1501 domain-containing protein [Mucilaginibacter ginkgonis]|uniref:DUF1501 domain-containing protein n=1 Tax=Mucilaginibacter ginkgonis TaxID=2682091 RepID=A0A6I4I498_9SPHI|nr:DUF1501 domain-containing protein [Mucilaginibacter ginkgonis]QQL48819.1 DUF1501 domain-containing protein [Mucilaginibacter ginkgonis]
MNRRDFIGKALPAGVVMPKLINDLTFKAFGVSPFLEALVAAPTETDHVLVLIQLNGGNDGLNTVIPFDQYDNLANARGNIIIPKNKVLKLDGTSYTGIHTAMTGLQSLYNDGKAKIIQSVGYPQPNFSHFRATDIWLTGANSDQVLTSGWAGRYLAQQYTNFPVGYPNTIMPDPLAIQIGSSVSPALQGPSVNMGMAITDPNNFYSLISGKTTAAPNTNAGKELTYIRQVAQQTTQYGTVIKAAASKVTKQGAYPSNNSLADQLKVVARLIAGGLKTRVYMVNIGSFDTHSAQVNTGAQETGYHATMLGKVSDAIKAFMDDLKGLGASKRVAGMTFSEFGRRIKSNASVGTDHGAAAPMILFGDYIQPGVLGTSPVISNNVGVNDNIPMQYDFRSVYASLLQQWFCVDPSTLGDILLNNFQSLPVIKSSAPCVSTQSELNASAGDKLISNYPNPFQSVTHVSFKSSGGHVLIQIFDVQGKLISNLVDNIYDQGNYEVRFDAQNIPPGVYYARLQNGSLTQTRGMVAVR